MSLSKESIEGLIENSILDIIKRLESFLNNNLIKSFKSGYNFKDKTYSIIIELNE